MNDDDKKIFFYIGILVLFVASFCWFNTSHIDGRRSEDIGARINDSQNINTELQAGTERIQQATDDSQRAIEDAVRRLESAEKELDRATSSIERCQQILGTAESRAQSTDSSVK